MPFPEQSKFLQPQDTGTGGSRDLFRGYESISFSVSTIAKAYNLKYDLGRAISSISQTDQSKYTSHWSWQEV